MSDSPAEQAPDEIVEASVPAPSSEAPAKKPLVRKSLIVATVIVLALVATVFGVKAYNANARSTQAEQHSIKIGRADAPVVVDVYLDFMCPACGMFESASGDDLASRVADGTARVRVHTMNFLDRASMGARYSSRAAAAFVAVAAAEPDKALAFSKALFDNQPKEGTRGLTDEQIAGLATSAGVSPTTVADLTNPAHLETVNNINDASFDAGVESTPTVLVNGKQVVSVTRPGSLAKAIQAGI